ncbi:MAG: phosphopantetheine-binding protein, partial [Blastocatellia bacterium]
IEAPMLDGGKNAIAPRNVMEETLAAAVAKVLRLSVPLSVHDDFFNDLGGDSLNAAVLISLLRDDPATQSVTVRDIYEARTIAKLAERVRPTVAPSTAKADEPTAGFPILATVIQALWLVLGLIVGSAASYFAAFDLLPLLIQKLGLIPFVVFSPLLFLAGLAVYVPLVILLTALVKKILIGSYQPMQAPVWSSFYVRNWMVATTARAIPWQLIEGTEFQNIALRALGTRIGRRVHIHRGVNLRQGGWDLLTISDNVTISQDASIRLVELSEGQVIVGAVSLGENSTLDVRAGVSGNTALEAGAFLAASASLPSGGRIPAGERWDGIPAKPAGQAPNVPHNSFPLEKELSPLWQSCLMLFAQSCLTTLLALPFELPLIALALIYGWNDQRVMDWIYFSSFDHRLMLIAALLVMASVPASLLFEALAMRALGTVQPVIISRWSLAYIRVWLKTDLLRSAGEKLSGTLFWPAWLRLAGMKVGRECEISTIIDVVPELIEIGDDTFFADGIYLGGPQVHRGTVTLAKTRLGANTFLGNHAIISTGQQLPDDILLGVCTVADDRTIRHGSSWFGHPPFELPRREIVECDRSLTHEPSLIRYCSRLFWELLRFALPVTPLLTLPVFLKLLADAEEVYSRPAFLFSIVPALAFATVATFCLLILALKWLLIGKVKPGIHPLWSCWCSRWDFLYVAWAVYARAALSALEGTLLLSWYLRAMGSQIGKRVVLGSGFSHVVDPDMLHFEDGATVCCQFQAHTFEDRVLKIDHVWIRRRATVESNSVLLYGADIGEAAYVAPHSVVMKRESLLPGHSYSGCPTKPE